MLGTKVRKQIMVRQFAQFFKLYYKKQQTKHRFDWLIMQCKRDLRIMEASAEHDSCFRRLSGMFCIMEGKDILGWCFYK